MLMFIDNLDMVITESREITFVLLKPGSFI